jgi:hypothetical protein
MSIKWGDLVVLIHCFILLCFILPIRVCPLDLNEDRYSFGLGLFDAAEPIRRRQFWTTRAEDDKTSNQKK